MIITYLKTFKNLINNMANFQNQQIIFKHISSQHLFIYLSAIFIKSQKPNSVGIFSGRHIYKEGLFLSFLNTNTFKYFRFSRQKASFRFVNEYEVYFCCIWVFVYIATMNKYLHLCFLLFHSSFLYSTLSLI